MILNYRKRLIALSLLTCLAVSVNAFSEEHYATSVVVDGSTAFGALPVTLSLDEITATQDLTGAVDVASITVVDKNGTAIPHALSESFNWSESGDISWVVAPNSTDTFEIRFTSTEKRRPFLGQEHTPRIGNGDLLRYNTNALRPVVVSYLSGLYDINRDGTRDVVGCWNYAYRPGAPWDGVIVYPGRGDAFAVGELNHLRYESDKGPAFFSSIYMHAAMADLNGDGFLDVVYAPLTGDTLQVFLHPGTQEAGAWPVYLPSITLPRPKGTWNPCRIVDLDEDGALDIVIGAPGKAKETYWLRNTNPEGWPMALAEPLGLDVGEGVCFFDVDKDGRLDAVGLRPAATKGVHEYEIIWQPRTVGDGPTFGEANVLTHVAPHFPTHLASVNDGPDQGLLVVHDVYQKVSLFPQGEDGFGAARTIQSRNAVMSLSDQAWPTFCDWDDDGDLDILVGGGYGWPRIVINSGTTEHPAYEEAQRIEAAGKAIRILRNEILGEPLHTHNMGYSYPVFADWDGDGLRDLIIPNETNRILWWKNVGSKNAPAFGPQQRLAVDGFEDSEAARRRSAERALKSTYPQEEEQPFYWRTGAAVFDWNGDGLMDIATHDGAERKLTLFSQYRTAEGTLRLRKDRKFLLEDGRPIDDQIVKRAAHWTESFTPVDWDRDGLMDLMYACAGTRPADGSIYLLRNVGTAQEAVFAAPRTMTCFGEPIKVTSHGPHPWAGDVDGDGFPDLVTCVEWSVYPWYRHAALELDGPPTYHLETRRIRP